VDDRTLCTKKKVAPQNCGTLRNGSLMKEIPNDQYFKPLGVRVSSTRELESALTRFKRMVKEDGILIRYIAKQEYEKPSAKRRRKRNQAIARQKYSKREK
jgi:small subunit ribosomal protein S21